MKIIGYRIFKEYDLNYTLTSVEKMLTVIECDGMEVRKHTGRWTSDKVDPAKNYKVYMQCAHPTRNFFVIGCKLVDNKVYEWMTLNEAESIVERAAKSDVIDLREIGDYHICDEYQLQTVLISNEYDEDSDEPIPIAVSVADCYD